MAKSDAVSPENQSSKAVEASPVPSSMVDVGALLKTIERNAPGVLSSVPADRRAKLVGVVVSSVASNLHFGPLPPPTDIALYDQYIPGGADRIMKMAEKQSDHRIAIETQVITSQQRQSGRGQIFGLVIAIFGISVGAYVALHGQPIVGGAIAGATVISLVYAFVSGQNSQRRDLERKAGK